MEDNFFKMIKSLSWREKLKIIIGAIIGAIIFFGFIYMSAIIHIFFNPQ